ncbi:hypothetical protein GCM10010405_13960 [Streptomyces macrosporus]|uniref:Uncharacterized protein n=1 Tax=Streptomyces macrosporus TaxID=44032 RepID=A0ABN3JKG4_9ACTN
MSTPPPDSVRGTPTVVAVGKPVPGNAGDCRVREDSGAKAAVGTTSTVIAGGGCRGTGLVVPHRRRRQGEAPARRTTAALHRPLGMVHRLHRLESHGSAQGRGAG